MIHDRSKKSTINEIWMQPDLVEADPVAPLKIQPDHANNDKVLPFLDIWPDQTNSPMYIKAVQSETPGDLYFISVFDPGRKKENKGKVNHIDLSLYRGVSRQG